MSRHSGGLLPYVKVEHEHGFWKACSFSITWFRVRVRIEIER